MRKLRIGIFPLSPDLSHPGDRRRFASWALNRKHELIVGEYKNVDLVFLSERSDFLSISKKVEAPVVFDLIDGYLGKYSWYQDLSRGLVKSLMRSHDTYPRTYSSIVKETCKNVALVVCSSPEQRDTIVPHHSNVEVILDDHSEIPFIKFIGPRSVARQKAFWEGTAHTLNGLEQLVSHCGDELGFVNLVTDLEYYRIMDYYLERNTEKRIRRKFSTFPFKIYPWNISNLLSASSESNFAILPVNKASYLQHLKPENRLLIMFRLGLPCITSDLLSYKRIEETIGVKITCSNWSDWRQMLNLIQTNTEFASHQIEIGQKYLLENHTQELLFDSWDKAIQGII